MVWRDKKVLRGLNLIGFVLIAEQLNTVLAINGKPVASVDQVRAAMARGMRIVALLVQRGRDKLFVSVRPG